MGANPVLVICFGPCQTMYSLVERRCYLENFQMHLAATRGSLGSFQGVIRLKKYMCGFWHAIDTFSFKENYWPERIYFLFVVYFYVINDSIKNQSVHVCIFSFILQGLQLFLVRLFAFFFRTCLWTGS